MTSFCNYSATGNVCGMWIVRLIWWSF